MSPGQLKGTLLEYLIRNLLVNCGFLQVKPDDHYVYEQNGTGLFFVNGKGAAHDADVLMEPPIQMPFTYPSRILFECKAYQTTTGLNVVRNALGLRYDINEFEIVTDESIQKRKNNRRDTYAISERKRYNYQVGVASVESYSASAFEFAANNKIPLFCLRWMLPDVVCNLFHQITGNYVSGIDESLRQHIYRYLKFKGKIASYEFEDVEDFIGSDGIIGRIIRSFRSVMGKCFIGLIETGDLIFLFSVNDSAFNFMSRHAGLEELRARIYYDRDDPDVWRLSLNNREGRSNYRFYVPDRIMNIWKEYSLDKQEAINIKERYFSKIFIFTPQQERGRLPFVVVNIDQEWLNDIRE